MFGRFWHGDGQKLDSLLDEVAAALAKYNRRDLDTDAATEAVLTRMVETLRSVGGGTLAGQAESLKAELTTAREGINPYTMQKTATGGRSMRRLVVFKVLQSAQRLLDDEARLVRLQLHEAGALTGQVTLAAMQAGAVKPEAVACATNQAAWAEIWRRIGADPALHLARQRILLMVSHADALLLCADVASALRDGESSLAPPSAAG